MCLHTFFFDYSKLLQYSKYLHSYIYTYIFGDLYPEFYILDLHYKLLPVGWGTIIIRFPLLQFILLPTFNI